jgi:hypothetical protein
VTQIFLGLLGIWHELLIALTPNMPPVKVEEISTVMLLLELGVWAVIPVGRFQM